jgi:hypothetical protein
MKGVNIMSKEVEQDFSRYCYDIALSAIQYSDDSMKWSPNNIRRLIISADGVVVQLHTGTKLMQKPFDKEKASKCFVSENYKPMVSALTDRVCSSIEEIIYCTGSINGLKMNQKELDLRSIIVSHKVSNNDDTVKDAIMTRFKRLRSLIITSQTLSGYMLSQSEKLYNHTYQSADSEEVKRVSQVIDMHKDDWYLGYFLRGKDYSLDKEGGHLYTLLHKVETEITEAKRISEIADSKKKHLGETLQKAENARNNVLKVLVPYRNIAMLMNKSDLLCIYNTFDKDNLIKALTGITQSTVIFNSNGVLNDSFVKIAKQVNLSISEEKRDSKEDLLSLTQLLNNLYISLYSSLASSFLNLVNLLGRQNPLMIKTKLAEVDRAIFIPESLHQYKVESEQYFSSALEGKNITDSVANICSIMCFLLLSDSDGGYTKYTTKDCWLNYIKGGC